MKNKGSVESWKSSAILTLLALVFTIGLTFTAIEIPRLLDGFMGRNLNVPALATGQDAETDYKTGLYLEHYHLREIGYAALGITLLLIITGLARGRGKMAASGAILLFLPVFGQFAATMFFLGGLAFLRLLWLPFLDISFDLMRLGDIALVPYRGVVRLCESMGLYPRAQLPFIICGIGLFIFLAGTLAWFITRSRGRKVADFWVYRISRHPQYLGWIIWSYGILHIPGDNQKRYFELSNALPWVLSTLVIIGVALFEELKMKKISGNEYIDFQKRTPFLFPLPGFITRLLKLPHRLIFKKNRFQRKREILLFLLIHAVCIMGISAWSSGMFSKGNSDVSLSSREISGRAERIRNTANRLVIRRDLKALSASGEKAIPHLLTLSKDDNPIVRWYTIDTLGSMESPAVIPRLMDALADRHHWVRHAAARNLGGLRARRAVPALIRALEDPQRKMTKSAARALGMMGDRRAVTPLVRVLMQFPPGSAGAAARALGKLGFRDTVPHLVRCMSRRDDCPFNEVGFALIELGSDKAVDAFTQGLHDPRWWQRQSSLRGLAEIPSPASLERIATALNDHEPKVRRSAVWHLRRFSALRPARVLELLLPMRNDPDFEVRLYAGDTIRFTEGLVPRQ